MCNPEKVNRQIDIVIEKAKQKIKKKKTEKHQANLVVIYFQKI